MDLPYATNGNRFLAFMLDVLPITLLAFLIYYFFFDFDVALEVYLENKGDVEMRKSFILERNKVRNLSLIIWVVYGSIMDGTKWQGTHGKKIMNLHVADEFGLKLSLADSFKRNFGKLISVIPLFIGVFWVFFDKKKRTLHDKFVNTLLLDSRVSLEVEDWDVGEE